MTAVGVVVILHDRKMTAWINIDEFGNADVPELPNENISISLALAAAGIGVISFIALLRLP